MNSESWRPVVGYEASYEVSDLGRVRKTGSSVALIANPGKHPYLRVALIQNGKLKAVAIHLLVARAFIGPSMDLEVNHRDGNKFNPALSNLEYVTPAENRYHAYRVLRQSKIPVAEIPSIKARLSSGEDYKEIAKEFGVHRAAVHRIKSGKNWKSVLSLKYAQVPQ